MNISDKEVVSIHNQYLKEWFDDIRLEKFPTISEDEFFGYCHDMVYGNRSFHYYNDFLMGWSEIKINENEQMELVYHDYIRNEKIS